MAKVAAEAVSGLQAQIDAVTADPGGAPGVVFAAVNKAGEIIFQHASGKVGVGKDADMTMDTVFWIAGRREYPHEHWLKLFLPTSFYFQFLGVRLKKQRI